MDFSNHNMVFYDFLVYDLVGEASMKGGCAVLSIAKGVWYNG